MNTINLNQILKKVILFYYYVLCGEVLYGG